MNLSDRKPRVFGALSELKLLNLDGMRYNAEQIIPVLDAAAIHCPKLDSLILPLAGETENKQHVEAVMKTLYKSLKLWRTIGNRGGLRRLRVPRRKNDPRKTKEFIDTVIANCPQVEILDGYQASLFASNCLICDDSWLLTLCDWKRFNATCTNLQEFNWVIVPFGDPYFRVFGEHIKPRLKKLTFCVNMYWEWQWNFLDISKAARTIPDDWEQLDYCERPGYGYLATDVKAALKGCPLLDDLSIELYHPISPDADLYSEESAWTR